MNFRGGQKGRGRVEATLELTPLIDVIFLLLIFFVMTTTPAMSAVERLDVDLPGAESGDATEAPEDQVRVVMRVYRDGTIEVREGQEQEGEAIDDSGDYLEGLREREPSAAIWIQGDVEASHGAVIEILDGARQVGFERVQMAVRPPGGSAEER